MDGGQPRRPKLAYPRRRGIKNPSREAFLVETTTPLPYRRRMANATLQASDLLALLHRLSSELKRGATLSRLTTYQPGDDIFTQHSDGQWIANIRVSYPEETKVEKPKDTRKWRWITNEVGYFVGKDSHPAAPIPYGARVVVKGYDPLASDWLLVCFPDKRNDVPLSVRECDVAREQPAELDPQGEIIPFPTTKPSQPQWEVKFVQDDGVQPAGWEPFAVTDRHIALRRRVQ